MVIRKEPYCRDDSSNSRPTNKTQGSEKIITQVAERDEFEKQKNDGVTLNQKTQQEAIMDVEEVPETPEVL